MGYAYVAKGYKAGSFPALSGSSDLAFTPATQESVITYETGIKTQPFDRRTDIDLSVFYSDYRDKQVKSKLNDPVFGQLDALVNIPKSTIKGVELQTTTRVTSGLTLGANATYLDATLDNTGNRISLLGSVVPGQNLNYSSFCGVQSNGYSLYCGKNGNPIPFTSKWNAGGNANYTIPIGENSVFIGGQVTYRSWTTSSIGNEPLFRMPGYTLVDTQAGYDFGAGKYRVMVWGKNIFNRFYVVNVDRYTDGVQRYTGMPGTFGVTFSAKF
jgi:outer membrane receptor protein involved in Fe transport